MAQVKLLKIGSTGLPTEFDSASDEITLISGQFGNVKASANSIISTDTNGDLNLTPNGTGDLVFDGVKWPQADGTANQILKTNGSAQLSWTDAFAAALDDGTNFVADTPGVTIRDVVYVSSSGKVSPADASAESTARAIGFATNTAASTVAVTVRMGGCLSGFSGMTAGARQYLSETAGARTETPPTTSGAEVLQVGYAVTAAIMKIQFQHLGVRA